MEREGDKRMLRVQPWLAKARQNKTNNEKVRAEFSRMKLQRTLEETYTVSRAMINTKDQEKSLAESLKPRIKFAQLNYKQTIAQLKRGLAAQKPSPKQHMLQFE